MTDGYLLNDEAVVDIMQILLIIKVSIHTNTADSDCTVVFFIFYVISSNLSLNFFILPVLPWILVPILKSHLQK